MAAETSEKLGFQFPFSAYDFFGYLIPGAAFLLSGLLFEFMLISRIESPPRNALHTPIYTLFAAGFNGPQNSTDWSFGVLYLVTLLAAVYILGHVISSCASFLVDRILIYKGYGYPYETLLELEKPKNEGRICSEGFYRGMLFWVNAGIILIYICISTGQNSHAFTNIFIGYSVVMALVIAIKIILSTWLARPERALRQRLLNNRIFRLIENGIIWIMGKLVPLGYNLVGSFISKFLRTREKFDSEFIDSYKRLFKKEFGMQPKKAESNNYWLSYCYIMNGSNSMNRLCINWLNLYSFSRNISIAFYLAAIYCMFSVWLHIDLIRTELSDHLFIKTLPIVYFIGFMIMLNRYYYLYYAYFSKFVFRAFVFLAMRGTGKESSAEPKAA